MVEKTGLAGRTRDLADPMGTLEVFPERPADNTSDLNPASTLHGKSLGNSEGSSNRSLQNNFSNPFHKLGAEVIDQALSNLAQRTHLPNRESGSSGALTLVNLNQEIKEKYGSHYELMPASSTVRSMLSYLYAQIYRESTKDKTESAESILSRTITDDKSASPVIVFGVGARLEFVAKRTDGVAIDEDELAKIQIDVESSFGGETSLFRSPLVRSLSFEQTEDAAQAVDYASAAFSLDQHKLINLDASKDAIAQLLTGSIMHEIQADAAEESRRLQTVSTLESLVMMPWAKLDLNSRTTLIRDIYLLADDLERGEGVTDELQESLRSVTAKAWFSGSNNRLFMDEQLAPALSALNEAHQNRFDQRAVPQFLAYRELSEQNALEDFPPEFLMSQSEFQARYGNIVYHGTPTVGLSILRENFLLTGKGQGYSSEGSGAYTTLEFSTALGIRDHMEWVIPLAIKSDDRLRIFDFREHKDHPWVKEHISATTLDDPTRYHDELNQFFDLLREKYHIDIIINYHVLLQNAAAVNYPSGLGSLYESATTGDFGQVALEYQGWNRLKERLDYAQLVYDRLLLSGEDRSGFSEPPDFMEVVKRIAEENPNRTNEQGFSLLHSAIRSKDPEVARALLRSGADPNMPDRNGFTPLYWAQQQKDTELIDILKDFGARDEV